jgi:hypothetical protein
MRGLAGAPRRAPPTPRRERRTRAPADSSARASGSPPLSSAADELQQRQVAGRNLVVAALAVQRELLHRPRADARDRAQPPPAALVLGAVQVDAHRAQPRARRARARARGRRPESKDCSSAGAVPASVAGAGRSRRPPAPSQSSAARRPSEATQAALDRDRPLVLDQLLADRPGERLERLRAPADAQPRAPAQRAPDQRIAGEAPQKGLRSSSTPSAKRIRAMPWAAAGRWRARAPNRTRSAPAARPAPPPAHRRGAAGARAPRRAGAAPRPPARGSLNGPARRGRRPLRAPQGPASSLSDRRRRAGARPRAASGCRRSGPAHRLGRTRAPAPAASRCARGATARGSGA